MYYFFRRKVKLLGLKMWFIGDNQLLLGRHVVVEVISQCV